MLSVEIRVAGQSLPYSTYTKFGYIDAAVVRKLERPGKDGTLNLFLESAQSTLDWNDEVVTCIAVCCMGHEHGSAQVSGIARRDDIRGATVSSRAR